jgi:hypothetical protein
VPLQAGQMCESYGLWKVISKCKTVLHTIGCGDLFPSKTFARQFQFCIKSVINNGAIGSSMHIACGEWELPCTELRSENSESRMVSTYKWLKYKLIKMGKR